MNPTTSDTSSTMQDIAARYLKNKLSDNPAAFEAVAGLLFALKKCSTAFDEDTIPLNFHPFTSAQSGMVHQIADACGLPKDQEPWKPKDFDGRTNHRSWFRDTFYCTDAANSLDGVAALLLECLERGRAAHAGV